jgi:hypothetical protein
MVGLTVVVVVAVATVLVNVLGESEMRAVVLVLDLFLHVDGEASVQAALVDVTVLANNRDLTPSIKSNESQKYLRNLRFN